MLDGDAATRLAQALTDEDNYGWTKQLAMQEGSPAGLDLSTEAGLKAWMRELERPAALPPPKKKAAGANQSQESRKRSSKKSNKTPRKKKQRNAKSR